MKMRLRLPVLALALSCLSLFYSLIVLNQISGPSVSKASAQDAPKPKAPPRHHRGLKLPPLEVLIARHKAAFLRHGYRMKALPNTTADSFDCRTALGNVLPVDDQGQCGDCFGVSSADGCSMALIMAGQLPLDASKGRLSSQYGLDNSDAFQGGCDGGDEAQVIEFIKTKGFPLTSEYGPYTASPGRVKDISGMKILKISDYGYCTPAQQGGIASTQDMKNAMVRYGPLSVAFDAGGTDSYTWPAVMSGGGNSVDHAVLCIGWRTATTGKTEFLGMNQWGDWGGPGGTFWIEEGAWSWGTEAIWITATPVGPPLPPPGPGPTPPGPTPPTPVPGNNPIVSAVVTFSDGTTQTIVVVTGQTTLSELVKALATQGAQAPHLPTPPNPNCQCGCTTTGRCVCKDCDHPALTPPAKPLPGGKP